MMPKYAGKLCIKLRQDTLTQRIFYSTFYMEKHCFCTNKFAHYNEIMTRQDSRFSMTAVSKAQPLYAVELAQFILAAYPDKGITPMKLQKLSYYAKSWILVAQHHPFIQADFEKWSYGPVNVAIYNAYKKHGAEVIPPGIKPAGVSKEQENLLAFILDNYVDYSAFTLSAMTHNEAPWLDAEKNTVISDAAIFFYYSNQPFAKNFIKIRNAAQQPFHVLKSNSWHSFTLDMDKEEAETFASYPTAEDYQQQSQKAKHDFQNLLQKIDELF